MITEDYVSFEVAKLLKEKGFDEDCHAYWNLTTETKTPKIGLSVSSKNWNYKWNPIPFPISAPTLQMAMKWLREVHKIHITIYPYGEYQCDNYQFDIYKNKKYLFSRDEGYMTNEQACEAAIKYCLENLI